MLRRALLTVAGVAGVVFIVVGFRGPEAPVPETAIKSHHLVNLPQTVTEEQFASALQDMNAAIAKTGYDHAGYRFWKVTGEQAGEYQYLWEGNWPSQEAYDAIHSHAEYEAAAARMESLYNTLVDMQVYNRYVEIPVGFRHERSEHSEH